MVPQLVARSCNTKIPLVDPTSVPGDGVDLLWPHCTGVCVGSRSDRACPLITQYTCKQCNRVVAYLIHGLRADIKRRFYGETKVIHLWPNFQDDKYLYCVDCANKRYPKMESTLKMPLLEAWRKRRDFDHICEEVYMEPHYSQITDPSDTVPIAPPSSKKRRF